MPKGLRRNSHSETLSAFYGREGSSWGRTLLYPARALRNLLRYKTSGTSVASHFLIKVKLTLPIPSIIDHVIGEEYWHFLKGIVFQFVDATRMHLAEIKVLLLIFKINFLSKWLSLLASRQYYAGLMELISPAFYKAPLVIAMFLT